MGRRPIEQELAAVAERAALVERRANRPSVLRPWRTECLVLRAGDSRIVGRIVAERTGERRAGGGRGEVVRRDAGVSRLVSSVEAERIGLWRSLEALRRASWQGPSHEPGELARVELVAVDASLINRVCRWPVLPAGCTRAEAARLLGVTWLTIREWLATGKLVQGRTLREYSNGRKQVEVSYSRWPRLPGVRSGREFKWPERSVRGLSDDPDVDWAVERFDARGRRDRVVRIARFVRCGTRSGIRRERKWICPSCGGESTELLLPAGPMARVGRLWSAWRFQCRSCTGADSECKSHDMLGQWIQKKTCGWMNGPEFHRALDVWSGVGRREGGRM